MELVWTMADIVELAAHTRGAVWDSFRFCIELPFRQGSRCNGTPVERQRRLAVRRDSVSCQSPRSDIDASRRSNQRSLDTGQPRADPPRSAASAGARHTREDLRVERSV